MSGFSLRHYQRKGINLVYEAMKSGHRKVIFHLATGGGKSHSFCVMIKELLDSGAPVVICVKRRELITQASRNLTKHDISHGVYMSKHRRFRPKELVQICSIDTLDARNLYPHSDLTPVIIIDEAHDCRPSGKKYVRFLDEYPNSPVVGFTATPYGDNGLFDKIVKPIEMHELLEQGFLTPVKMFTPNQIDVSNVKIKRTGDYDEKELFRAASSSQIIGDFVRDWQAYSQGRPTVLFAVNIEHSEMIAKAFNDAGIVAVHADAKTKTEKREHLLRRLGNGEIKVLCNVNIFSTGVDLPAISCIQVCRPTQSLIWYLQSIGRGLRPSPETGKTNCIIIDNAGNTFRFGSPFKAHNATIEKSARRDPDEEDITIRRCKSCNFIFEADQKICPECNYINPPVERKIKHSDGDLVEYNLSPEEQVQMEKGLIMADCFKLKHVARKRGFKKTWIFFQLKNKYGVDKLETNKEDVFTALSDYEV